MKKSIDSKLMEIHNAVMHVEADPALFGVPAMFRNPYINKLWTIRDAVDCWRILEDLLRRVNRT